MKIVVSLSLYFYLKILYRGVYNWMIECLYKYINRRISIYFKINYCLISLLVGFWMIYLFELFFFCFYLMILRLNGCIFFINNLDMILWSILILRYY